VNLVFYVLHYTLPLHLNAFRLLTANDDHLKNNFRPIQPLNDRTLYKNYIEIPIHNMGSIPLVDAENAAGKWRAQAAAVLLPLVVLAALSRTSIFRGF